MYRNHRGRFPNQGMLAPAAVCVLAALLLTACGDSGKLFTDVGSSGQQEIPREEYLQTNLTASQEEQTAEDLYQVYTLERGTYTEESRRQSPEAWNGCMTQIRYSLEGIKARYGENTMGFMQYANAGDTVAIVYPETNELAVIEADLKLKRLKERFSDAEKYVEQELAEILDQKALIYNDYKKWILDVRYRQRQRDWEQEKYQYENQIREAEAEAEKLAAAGETYPIITDTPGYVYYFGENAAGKELKEGDLICCILPPDLVYESVSGGGETLVYGMERKLILDFGEITGRVVSGGSQALYGNLDTGNAMIRVDVEEDQSGVADAQQETQSADGSQVPYNHLYDGAIMQEGIVRTVKNVVLVPKEAVTVTEDGEYFVTVLKEDGSLLKTEFLPGGGDSETYWVLEGLSEGMQIVYH